MVNRNVNVQLARQARRGVAILHAQLAPGAVAIGIDGSLRHAEFAGDLLRRQVLIDQPQAFALAWREQSHRIFGDDVACSHSLGS
jgi:hypothetical protein